MPLTALPYIIFLGFLFGSTLIVSRFSVGQFEPSTYVGLRLIIAGLAHMVFYVVARPGVARRPFPSNPLIWRRSVLLGVMGTALPMTMIVSSLQFLSSGLAAILITTGPALTVLFAHFSLSDERLTRNKTIGVLIALSGALLLAVRGESGLPDVSQVNPLGYLLNIGALTLGSSMTIYARKYMRKFDDVDVASIRMWTAAVLVLPISVAIIGFDLSQVDATGYAGMVYAAAAGTFGGMLLSFYNIKRFGATASAMTAYVVPIVTGIGGVLVLDETITAGMLVGMGLIVGGVALLNTRPGKSQPRVTPT